jgi:predicted dehydrogenase
MTMNGKGTGPAVRAAIVGLGAISLEHIEKLLRQANVEIVGLCDLDGPVVTAVCERYGIDVPFIDFEAMLAAARPDIVHVLTPPQSHRGLAVTALEAGAHVLVEKPIAPTADDYAAMRDAARSAGRCLVENYNWRQAAVVRRALEVWRSGAIGDVVHVDVVFGGVLSGEGGPVGDREVVHFSHALPGGALQNFASHPVSIALAFMDRCVGVSTMRRRLDPAMRSDDELRVLLAGERSSGLVSVTRHAEPPSFTLRVAGTEGAIEADLYNDRLFVAGPGGGVAKVVNGVRHGLNLLGGTAGLFAKTVTSRLDHFEGLENLIESLYRAVSEGAEPPVTLAEMDAVNEVMFRVFSDEGQL